MANVIKRAELTSYWTTRERLAMLNTIDKLSDQIGACEKLVQTPIPLAYARHTSRFLSVWLLTIPFVLIDLGLAIVPCVGIISWALFGIHEIGLQIEDPFKSQLQLDIMIDTIYADVAQTIGFKEILPTYQTSPFFAKFANNACQ